eukprot:222511_1
MGNFQFGLKSEKYKPDWGLTESERADKQIQRIKTKRRTTNKILLLGISFCGKSTLFSQLNCIYGYGEDIIKDYRHIIRSNTVQSMKVLLMNSDWIYHSDTQKYKTLVKKFGNDIANVIIDYTFKDWNILRVDMNNRNIYNAVQSIKQYYSESFAKEELFSNHKIKVLGETIAFLWSLDAIQSTFKRRGDIFAFFDNMDYFFDKAELLYLNDFEPNREDELKTTVRTTGIISARYEIKENDFEIYDCGGFRHERKKWIHYFDNATAVIFVAALNDCNSLLYEDESKNAMHESIELFEEICNLKHFKRSEMMLFLNKNDLFCEMLRNGYSLRECFHSENGWYGDQWDTDFVYDNKSKYDAIDYQQKEGVLEDLQHFEFCYEQNVRFIQDQYVQRNRNPKKVVFVHITTATNRDNVARIMWDVQNIIIRSNLQRGSSLLN